MNTSTRESGRGRWIFRFAAVVCFVTLILTITLVISYRAQLHQRTRRMKSDARDASSRVVKRIGGHLTQIKPEVQRLANDLSAGRLTGEALRLRLENVFRDHEEAWQMLEVGVAYLPEQSPLGPGQNYAPHFGRFDNEPRGKDISQDYDYHSEDWFVNTVSKGALWIDPYFGRASQRFTAGYAATFHVPEAPDSVAGVVRINFDLEDVTDSIIKEVPGLVSENLVMTAGYLLLVSHGDKVLTHPIESYIGRELAELKETDGTLRAIAGAPDRSTAELGYDIIDPVTGESYWILETAIDETNWRAIVVFNSRETKIHPRTVRFYQRAVCANVVLFLCAAAFLWLHRLGISEPNLWIFAVLTSSFFVGGTIAIWGFAVTSDSRDNEKSVLLADDPTAYGMARRHGSRRVVHDDKTFVPTGVFVQSLTFASANNVRLTGFIWQRKSGLPDTGATDELLGFLLPEAEEVSTTKAYENEDVIGWYVETTLREQFDYSRYPFDLEEVWIRLWPKAMNPKVVLVPDFDGYEVRDIASIPGVEQDLVLEGWSIQSSSFSFRNNRYTVNFGRPEFDPTNSLELYFNVGLRRNFVSPFVADLIPILVVAFLVFAVLMCSTKHEQQMNLYGFSTSSVLAYCAALFFVLIVSHVHLRNTLAAHGIIYMEYFYFVMYVAILMVSADSLLFASRKHYGWIDYEDNIVVKQLYWPTLTGAMFVITLIVFQ